MATYAIDLMHREINNPFASGLGELTMEERLGGCAFDVTNVEMMIAEQRGCREVPFAGMDKSGRGVCVKFSRDPNSCPLAGLCPLRHLIGDKQVVCKHWLRGLCKKGDQCEFLHEYDLSKMPECFFFSKFTSCSNKECPFRHIDPESKIKDCPWYDRGFCRHGPFCKHRHRRRVLCPLYLAGFCPKGKECKFTHPSFAIPQPDLKAQGPMRVNTSILCHNCHERGHKATHCPHLPNMSQPPPHEGGGPTFNARNPRGFSVSGDFERRSVADIVCYKCGEKGHYANKCSKGALAFLSNPAHLNPNITT